MIGIPKDHLDSKVNAKLDAVAERHKPQSDKFKDAAREHECDPDEKRWEERLKKVAKQKPRDDE